MTETTKEYRLKLTGQKTDHENTLDKLKAMADGELDIEVYEFKQRKGVLVLK